MSAIPNLDEPDVLELSVTDVYSGPETVVGTRTVHEDPYDRFALVNMWSEFHTSGDDHVIFQVENLGVPVWLSRLVLAISQGAEDGRWHVIGYYSGGEHPSSTEPWFLSQWMPGDVAGRGRTMEVVDFPVNLRPIIKNGAVHHWRVSGDADVATDSVKSRISAYYEPIERPGRTDLDL